MYKHFTHFTHLLITILLSAPLLSQDTFSIVGVDPETGEVGSAGASCVVGAANFGGVILISGIIPGRGGINAQANICIPHINLNIGMQQMELGKSPEEIMTYLIENDGCGFGDETQRQYGIVDFDMNGSPRSEAYSGANCLPYKGHRTGATYAIQGNILLGPEILDSMEARYNAATGPLAKRLMAAMQGANVPGADSRCLDDGTSSTSAYIRVAKPDDVDGNYYLEINVEETETGVEPIDSLQVLFDAWCDTAIVSNIRELPGQEPAKVYPNPTSGSFTLDWTGEEREGIRAILHDINGKVLLRQSVAPGTNQFNLALFQDRLVILQVKDASGTLLFSEKILIRRE